jgi:hypothetical protein
MIHFAPEAEPVSGVVLLKISSLQQISTVSFKGFVYA